MPKNPVRAARQAGRQAVRAAKDTRRETLGAAKTASKVAKIESRTASKVGKISGTATAKPVASKPATAAKPTSFKPSAPTVKLPATAAKPTVNVTADMRGKMKDMPAATRKAAPVKKATPKPTPRAVPAPPSPTPPKPTPAPKPEANMGNAYKMLTGKNQPDATPKQKLQMEARSANKKATAEYDAANAAYRKAFNEAKSGSSYDSQAEKDRKKAAVNDTYDKMRKAKEANTKTFLDEKSAYNRKHGGAVKKYQAGGMTTGMKPPRSVRGPKQSASDMRQPYGPSMKPVGPGNTARAPKAVRKAGPSKPASMISPTDRLKASEKGRYMKKGGTNKRK